MEDRYEKTGGYVCGNYYCIAHVIQEGDTLYKLSRQYGLKVSALMMANPFVDIYNLRIGDELCIPRLRTPGNENRMPQDAGEEETERVIDAEMPVVESMDTDSDEI